MNNKNLISFFLLTLFYELWITQTILSIEGWLHLNYKTYRRNICQTVSLNLLIFAVLQVICWG